MPSYNLAVVAQLLADRLDALGRGSQTRLADAVGVRVQTVNKWVKAQTMPEPERWPAIEEHLGLETGAIRRAAGYDRLGLADHDGVPPDDEITMLREEVARLREIVERLDKSAGAQ